MNADERSFVAARDAAWPRWRDAVTHAAVFDLDTRTLVALAVHRHPTITPALLFGRTARRLLELYAIDGGLALLVPVRVAEMAARHIAPDMLPSLAVVPERGWCRALVIHAEGVSTAVLEFRTDAERGIGAS